jgi:hypothetical protein
MKQTLVLFSLLLILSCGQHNGQETQSLQHHDDSLRAAIETEMNGHLQRKNDSLTKILAKKEEKHVSTNRDNNTTTIKEVRPTITNTIKPVVVNTSRLGEKKKCFNRCKLSVKIFKRLPHKCKKSVRS